MSDQQPWQRMPGEKQLWYSRFRLFLMQGPERSLNRTYREHLANIGQDRPGEIHLPRSWKNAVQRNRWWARAEAFDQAELVRVQREALEQYRADLTQHQERSRQVANATLARSLRLLQLVGARLDDLNPADIPVSSIPNFLRAFADLSEKALNADAEALGVSALLREMLENPPPTQDDEA